VVAGRIPGRLCDWLLETGAYADRKLLGILSCMADETNDDVTQLELPEEEWRNRLSLSQYYVLREKGTERAFSGEYTHPEFDGVFRCAGCGAVLFSSEDQFDSGSGWPSFTRPVDADAIVLSDDTGFGMHRVEVTCRRCGGHLGHLFPDGPNPSGERWCINSVSLDLDEKS
jgi:peptide-methionine (R)-S-oxide reductase